MTQDRRQAASFNLSYDAIHFFLIGEGNHEKLIAFVETDNTVANNQTLPRKGLPPPAN